MKSTLRLSISFALMLALAQEPASKVSPQEVQEAYSEPMRGLKAAPISFGLLIAVEGDAMRNAAKVREELTLTAVNELQDLGWKFVESELLMPPDPDGLGAGFTVVIKVRTTKLDAGALWNCNISVMEFAALRRFHAENGSALMAPTLVSIYDNGDNGRCSMESIESEIKSSTRDALDLLKASYRGQREKPTYTEMRDSAKAK